MSEQSPFRLMIIFFSGLFISFIYDVLGTCLVWYLDGESEAKVFFTAYTSSFKTIISLGLILGTMLLVYSTQNDISKMIEAAVENEELHKTKYFTHKQDFSRLRKTIIFGGLLCATAFAIFKYCSFPLSKTGEVLMLIAACAQYVLASFVGRKLMYTALMIHSLMKVKVTRNLFQKRELDNINWYVSVASTLTIIFVYVHVMNYYEGPFLYNSIFGQSVKIFLLFPAIIATPVLLIFNFYPREVIRRLYSESIDLEISQLQIKMGNEGLDSYQKRSYLMGVSKMSRDELRYSLQLVLTDLPIGITILIMVLQPLLKR